MMRFVGKVAIVTGGGKGIGRAVSLRVAAEGASVYAVAKSNSVDTVAAEAGSSVLPYRCDVSDPEQIKGLIEDCRSRFGKLDVLCNNAGFGHPPNRLADLPMEDWDRVMNTNIRGAFAVLKYAVPLMISSGGGAIVNMGSTGSFKPTVARGAYSVSKAALVMLTKTIAIEYVGENIRANTVCPGPIRTPLVESKSATFIATVASQTAMRRLGTAQEVAALTAFLLSDEASYITGAEYLVDGGSMILRGEPP